MNSFPLWRRIVGALITVLAIATLYSWAIPSLLKEGITAHGLFTLLVAFALLGWLVLDETYGITRRAEHVDSSNKN